MVFYLTCPCCHSWGIYKSELHVYVETPCQNWSAFDSCTWLYTCESSDPLYSVTCTWSWIGHRSPSGLDGMFCTLLAVCSSRWLVVASLGRALSVACIWSCACLDKDRILRRTLLRKFCHRTWARHFLLTMVCSLRTDRHWRIYVPMGCADATLQQLTTDSSTTSFSFSCVFVFVSMKCDQYRWSVITRSLGGGGCSSAPPWFCIYTHIYAAECWNKEKPWLNLALALVLVISNDVVDHEDGNRAGEICRNLPLEGWPQSKSKFNLVNTKNAKVKRVRMLCGFPF